MNDDLFEFLSKPLSNKELIKVMSKPSLGYSLTHLIDGNSKTIEAREMRGLKAANLFHVWEKKDRHYVRDLVNTLDTLFHYNPDPLYLSIMKQESTVKSTERKGYKPTWIEFVGGLIDKFRRREDLSTTQVFGLNNLLVELSKQHPAFVSVQEIEFK
ncbi:hypothetical protein G6M86_20920 [Agrobacterium tumefaciens]|uniref:Uncharacterized protein n=1 Tax=Agrobacterium tumefaciens TaxID=358 RepID=A0AAJ4N6G3_AGRTU|nr:hypothetical protein G6M86_20920 [Agrobacterium tumefaciens]